MRQQAIISAAAVTAGGVGVLVVIFSICLCEKKIYFWLFPRRLIEHNDSELRSGVTAQITARRGNMFVTKHEYISPEISLKLQNRNRILWLVLS